ncbi:ultraviolet-B receptor UVR8 isoform X3 [Dioscorea cayenensis subsp. rotundata]|uniref:Ultraviolet-B receptor UVR8 isoform X3 n=1 Tax=Dioscorea cayennensis subsp. rotundata TaxID=55577 RepID=A0AB40AHE3_DIOCR|nr:ultraviolet-B receptor UVR8 isoform X3 [Dioscorea cayenensis subsp. rotundata]
MALPMWRRASIQTLRAGARWLSTSSVPSRRFAAVWGNGDYGRLGLGGLESRWRPTVCAFFQDDDPPVSIACGGAHTLFLTESGRVYASGLNKFGQLGINAGTSHVLEPVEVYGFSEKVVEISAGYHHSSAITEDGKLFTWGNNSCGQLGLGKRAGSIVSTPTMIDCLADIKVSKVALGSEHSIAITDEGEVLSWGAGGSGRLGHGHQSSFLGFSMISSEYTPRLIKNFEGMKVRRIAAGMLHSACINEQGSVFIFGERTINKLGFGEAKNATRPLVVEQLPFSEEVACGGYHTCVVTNEGKLFTWGSNENGCLGLGSMDIVRTPQDLRSSLLKFRISQVSCGWKHTAAISECVLSGGNIYTWGWGGANGTFFEDGHSSGGQLGHGNDVDCFEPMMVSMDQHVKALQISCGFNHTGGIFEHSQD